MTRRLPVLALLLTTSIAAPTLFNSALADDERSLFASRLEFPALDAPEESEETLDAPLPTRMKLQDEAELKQGYSERRYSFDTPRQSSSERPFVDWERIEPGAFLGFVVYSSGFRADPSGVLGVSLRLPIPGLPGRWAAFAEGFVSHVNRDLAFFYSDQAGNWYGATVGGDYTLYEGSFAYFRARGGILYANFNGVRELDNGLGFLLGAELGFFWVKHTDRFRLTITPEYSFSGSDSLMLMTAGLSFYF
jgi:hypothetical protein